MRKVSSQWWDHLLVCGIVFLLGYVLWLASLNLSIFNPLKQALEDFKMTDVYFEMLRGGEKDRAFSDKIVLVDMTKQTRRSDIARTISDINACQPRVLMVDLVFQRPNADLSDDMPLTDAVVEGAADDVFSFKLVDYDPERAAFRGSVKSYFSDAADFVWGYSNILQTHPGGSVRLYTLTQHLGDTLVWSMPYLAACRYLGREPQAEDTDQRLIVYSDLDFHVIDCDSVASHADLLRDKVVILGALDEEADKHITPIGKKPGMVIQAYSTLSYIDHPTVRTMSGTTSFLLAFVVCMFCAWAGWRIRQRYPSTYSYVLKLFYFGLTALFVWLSFLCFVYRDYEVDLLYPLLGMALVEEGRLQYMFIVRGPLTKWRRRLAEKSIYYQ